jgi:hypothetical protein
MAIESAKFTLIKKEKDFEVRVYDEIALAMSKENDFRGYSGFNEAFDYISGSNDQNRKISMTTPVINESASRFHDHGLCHAFRYPF